MSMLNYKIRMNRLKNQLFIDEKKQITLLILDKN